MKILIGLNGISDLMIPKIKEDKIIRCASESWTFPIAYVIEKSSRDNITYTVFMLVRDKKYRNKYFEVESVVKSVGRKCSLVRTKRISDSLKLKHWKDYYDIEY